MVKGLYCMVAIMVVEKAFYIYILEVNTRYLLVNKLFISTLYYAAFDRMTTHVRISPTQTQLNLALHVNKVYYYC